MKQIESLEEWKELLRWNRKRLGAVRKNYYFMSGTMESVIRQKRLYRDICEDGLLVYLDEGSYRKLYYFWEKEKDFSLFSHQKPVLAEVIEHPDTGKDEIAKAQRYLYRAGFSLWKRSIQVEKPLLAQEDADISLKTGFRIGYCEEKDLAQVFGLWEEYLDATDIPADHYETGKGERILCVYDERGRVASTNWWKNTGTVSEGWHAVTHPDYYRQGLGSAILDLWCREARKEGMAKIRTWISEENHRSLFMCRKRGLLPNGRISCQYLLR